MTDNDEVAIPAGHSTIRDRIAAFEMLDSMRDTTLAAKIFRLSLIGFNRSEIAAMLQTTPQMVSQSVYSEKNKSKKKPGA